LKGEKERLFPCPIQTVREREREERRKERRGKEREEGAASQPKPDRKEERREGEEKRRERKGWGERESCNFREIVIELERERKRGAFPATATGSNGISGKPATQTPLASVPRAVFGR
jgi:hypothetical protein